MCYTIKNIADAYGVAESTLHSHISKLKKKRLFKKTSLGKFYNETDGKKLAELLGFDFQKLCNLTAQSKIKQL